MDEVKRDLIVLLDLCQDCLKCENGFLVSGQATFPSANEQNEGSSISGPY
jgi:hypothetical protein